MHGQNGEQWLDIEKYREPIPRGAPNRRQKQKRRAALVQAGFKCEKCGRSDYLTIHHKIPKSEGGSSGLKNVMILCVICHDREHGEYTPAKVLERIHGELDSLTERDSVLVYSVESENFIE